VIAATSARQGEDLVMFDRLAARLSTIALASCFALASACLPIDGTDLVPETETDGEGGAGGDGSGGGSELVDVPLASRRRADGPILSSPWPETRSLQ